LQTVAFVIDSLADWPTGKPTTVQKLRNSIDGMFPTGLAESLLTRVLTELERSGVVNEPAPVGKGGRG
jgi:DNA-binding HxlR family transcriptional regulator